MGERKFAQTVQVTWPRWPPCPYMVKALKIFFGTKRPMTFKLGMQHRVLKYYQIRSNNDPGLTLTYFTTRSNLVPYAFIWEKGKTMDFSENIVVYDIKVGRCSQLKWVYEVLWVPKVKVIHWPWSKSLRFNIFNFFSSITADFNISSALRWAIQDQWSSGFPLPRPAVKNDVLELQLTLICRVVRKF